MEVHSRAEIYDYQLLGWCFACVGESLGIV
jgi:hypothetical protein